jgi:hypothetical protein
MPNPFFMSDIGVLLVPIGFHERHDRYNTSRDGANDDECNTDWFHNVAMRWDVARRSERFRL